MAKTRNRYHEQLSSVPLFADLDRAELDHVGRAATELQVSAGHVLMREGEIANEMFVVVEGTLEVTRDDCVVADIGPGGFAGELALLTGHTRDATVTAKTAARLLHIDGRSFWSVLSEAPGVALKMLPIVAERAVTGRRAYTD